MHHCNTCHSLKIKLSKLIILNEEPVYLCQYKGDIGALEPMSFFKYKSMALICTAHTLYSTDKYLSPEINVIHFRVRLY